MTFVSPQRESVVAGACVALATLLAAAAGIFPEARLLAIAMGAAALGACLVILFTGAQKLEPAPEAAPPAQDGFAASQALSELLLNAFDSRVMLIGPDFKVLRANSAARSRYPEVLSLHAHQLFEGKAGPCGDCPLCHAFSTGKSSQLEGSEGAGSLTELVQVQLLPVRADGGAVQAVLRIARVVTAEKQLQAQLMLREKMSAFGLLAAGVAHEIGNPLAAIASQLRLAREAPEPGRTEATFDVVSREVTRIQGLLRELVTFARRPRTGHRLVSLDAVVEDVWRLISHEPRARSVTIERRASEVTPAVRAKEDHLVQVLLNLGINALDAMPEGGTLTFATAVEGDAAVVRVIDTGSGISPGVQARLFEPFFTTKDAGHGTGLGLFVSKGIVRELKGTLAVETTGPTGTVFCLRLPLERG